MVDGPSFPLGFIRFITIYFINIPKGIFMEYKSSITFITFITFMFYGPSESITFMMFGFSL
jgi:hypothetical protein